jgi:hypothetical protein
MASLEQLLGEHPSGNAACRRKTHAHQAATRSPAGYMPPIPYAGPGLAAAGITAPPLLRLSIRKARKTTAMRPTGQINPAGQPVWRRVAPPARATWRAGAIVVIVPGTTEPDGPRLPSGVPSGRARADLARIAELRRGINGMRARHLGGGLGEAIVMGQDFREHVGAP